MVQVDKKIALLHRYPKSEIKPTNAAFPYLEAKGIKVLTFKKFDRLSKHKKFWKSILWIVYAPLLVFGKGYEVIYCDDSYPFYPLLVKLASPSSKIVLRIGDFHLMYYYSGLVYKFLHFFEKLTWKMADKVLVISEAMLEEVNGAVVLDPVDPKDFEKVGERPFVSDDIVMFHGVLTKNKNIDVMLDIARFFPDVLFVIIGDGPDRKRLQSIAPLNVVFYGWIPFEDIPTYINACTIGLALRSDNPGNEYVVTSPFLQYGVMGKPCLVTRRKAYGDYEWQFSKRSELIIKIKELLKRPEEGKKLQKYILENHHAEKIAEEIWEILKQV